MEKQALLFKYLKLAEIYFNNFIEMHKNLTKEYLLAHSVVSFLFIRDAYPFPIPWQAPVFLLFITLGRIIISESFKSLLGVFLILCAQIKILVYR